MGQRLPIKFQNSQQTLEHPDKQLLSESPKSFGESVSNPLSLALCNAMENLDVDLDEELDRYRRYVMADKLARKQGRSQSISTHERSGQPSGGGGTQVVAIAPRPDAALPTANTNHSSETAPDGYLESSEALLRSLDDSDNSNYADHHLSAQANHQLEDKSDNAGLFASLMTPLGIGSLMLLILSSATLGYMVMNPSFLTRGTHRNPDPSAPLDDAASERIGISPDLSAGEFSELDLNSLSSIPPNQRSSVFDAPPEDAADDLASTEEGGAVEPSQIEPAPPSNADTATALAPSVPVVPVPFSNASQAVAPQPAPAPTPPSSPSSSVASPSPTPTLSTPAPSSPGTPSASTPSAVPPQSEPSSVAAVASAEPPQEGYVYVVTPYTGDRSLEQAQEAVSGAYVRNFPQGAQVQLGAFSTPERAQSLVQELNSQGIPAQVYSR